MRMPFITGFVFATISGLLFKYPPACGMNNILYMKVWLLKASCSWGWRLALTYQYLTRQRAASCTRSPQNRYERVRLMAQHSWTVEVRE